LSDDLANAQSELTAAQEKVEALLTAEEANPPFAPMPDPNKPRDDEDNTFKSDSSGLREAARELAQHRQAAQEPLAREYRAGGHGDPTPEHLTIDMERGARDLGGVREIEDAVFEAREVEEIQRQVDELRAEEAGQQPPAPDLTPQPETAPEALQEPTPSAEPRWKQLLQSDPEFRAEMDAIVQGHNAQTEQQRQIVEAAIANTAMIQGAAILADYPELHGLNGPALDGALRVFQQKEPQRHAALMQRAAQIQQTISQAQQFQAVRAQEAQAAWDHRQAHFDKWADTQDQAWEKSVEHESPEFIKLARKELPKLMMEKYGLSKDDLYAAWNGNALFRSAAGQKMMLDLYRYSQVKQSASRPARQAPPPVQRPGVSSPRLASDEAAFRGLRQAFADDPSPKTAARLLAARRREAARG
jgi:hypothetical protein